MEEPKERNLVIYGECAKCKNLVRIDIKLKTALVEEKQEEKPEEEKPNAEGEKPGTGKDTAESGNLRPDSGKGATPEASGANKPDDSAKSSGSKKARGK